MSDLAYSLPGNVEAPDPSRPHSQWLLPNVFPGIGETIDPNVKYVIPNPLDIVRDIEKNKEYYVRSLDSNYKPEYRDWNPNNTPEAQKNLLVGYGVGAVNEAYRAYYNETHVPNTVTISQYLSFKGNEVQGYRLFKGYDTSEANGVVISKHYDQTGKYLGDVIPVEHHFSMGEWVSVPHIANVDNGAIEHEDRITLVAINKDGVECSSALLVVSETNLTPSLNREFKEIATISVTSVYLDPNDSTVLLVPSNVTIDSVPITGIVHYTDGTSKTFNFNGSEGRIHGLEGKVLSRPDVDYPIVASYYLADDEVAFDAGGGAKVHKSIPLTLRLYQPDGMNVAKMFCVPEWIDQFNGYKLNWLLTDLERNEPIDVTPLVRYHPDFEFDPLAYNHTQKINTSVTLSDVHPRYTDYSHTQSMDILLIGPPNNNFDSWRMRYTQGAGWYGEEVECTNYDQNGVSVINVSNGYISVGEWIIDFYHKVVPVSDHTAGEYAPNPTHFEIRYNGASKRIAIDDYMEDIIWVEAIPDGSTVEIHWLVEKGGQYGNLGITPMTVRGI